MTAVDPVVRSIRIATTVNERLSVIYKQSSEVREAREFELLIGEAQQIYPEMWRHLDEARAALVQRGADVADYDALRAKGRPGELAVDNIETTEGINVLGLAFGQVEYFKWKTASFNKDGQARARKACEALMRAMPDVDWAAVAREEDAQIAAAGPITSSGGVYLVYGAMALILIWLLSQL